MAYLGNKPGLNFQDVTKDTFSGDASTVDFTLSVASATNDCEVFVENVQQEPTSAYSIAGKTLTFTSAPPSGTNNIYVLHRGKANLLESGYSVKQNATIFQNNKLIQEDLEVDAGYNAMAAGPLTVSSGVTVTVPTGSRLVVV